MLLPALLYCTLAVNPTIIPLRSEEDLKKISACLTCQYVLLTDIALSTPWVPLGDTSNAFSGLLDGQGHTITFSGFSLSADETAGLFGTMDGATVFNLKLSSSGPMNGLSGAKNLSFGLLAARANGSTVYGCTGTLLGSIDIAGGALTGGGMFGTIVNSSVFRCYASTSVTISVLTGSFIGGLAGNIANTTLESCEARVLITASTDANMSLAGLVGHGQGLSVLNTVVIGSLSLKDSGQKTHIGGIIGHEEAGFSGSVLTSCMCRITVQLVVPEVADVGGLIGFSNYSSTIERCNVALSVIGTWNDIGEVAVIGGVVGSARVKLLNITHTYINNSLSIPPQSDNSTLAIFVGGLVGYINATVALINQSAAIINLNMTVRFLTAGGLVGQIQGALVTIQNSGVSGMITALGEEQHVAIIGGLVGLAAKTTIEQCYYIGNITNTEGIWQCVGVLVGDMKASTLVFSFGVSFIKVYTNTLFAGGVGRLELSMIKGCYIHTSIDAIAIEKIAMGIMAGNQSAGVRIENSFGVGKIKIIGLTSSGSIGAFVGSMSSGRGNESITESYAWGKISIQMSSGDNLQLGGFVGTLSTQVELMSCLAYVEMTSIVVPAATGLLAGAVIANPKDPSPAKQIAFSVVYTIPKEQLYNIKLIGTNAGITIKDSYCAQYNGATDCIFISTLNTQTFLKNFDFVKTFQFNASIANGSLALRTLPVPTSESTIEDPEFVFPGAGSSAAWSASMWQTNPSVLGGYLYLATIDYAPHCGMHNGCHGIGTSPISTLCASGWSGASSLAVPHGCNIFGCTSDSDCSGHGVCSAGACTCANGYTGADCSEPVCVEIDGEACGFDTCVPLASAALTGVCQCQTTEYLTPMGSCAPGCPPLGLGVCLGAKSFACFPGYQAANQCFEYKCTAGADSCNGKGTCTGGACACTGGSTLLAGNCYTPCTASVTTGCLQLGCGEGNSCSNRGKCTPALDEGAASCMCNVDDSGSPTDTTFGGPLCAGCQPGYAVHNNDCVVDRCPLCDGGSCEYNETENAIVCWCPKGQIADVGVCRTHVCGKCATGTCLPIPDSQNPRDLFCICNTRPSDGTCYELDCLSCTGGSCVFNSSVMKIQCVCPNGLKFNEVSGACENVANRTSKTTTIILCVVIIGGAAIIAAATATGVIVTRKRQGWRHPRPTPFSARFQK